MPLITLEYGNPRTYLSFSVTPERMIKLLKSLRENYQGLNHEVNGAQAIIDRTIEEVKKLDT